VGEKYQVQFATNLFQNPWQVLTTITASGTSLTYTDPTPVSGSPRGFYRVVQVP
jgi:hypothetical protein